MPAIRNGNALVAELSSDFAPGWRDRRPIDQLGGA